MFGRRPPESSEPESGDPTCAAYGAPRARKYNRPGAERGAMTDDTIAAAVERFLDETESALDAYDQGYADADATLSVVRTHMDELAAAADEADGE